MATQPQPLSPWLFHGRLYEPETGLYWMRARHYHPRLGRFLQPDPIGVSGGSNLYAYANNNPLRWFDPWGLRPETAEQVLVPFVPDEYTFWEQSRDFLKFMFVDPAKETFNRGSRRFEESFQAAYGGDPALAVLSFTAAVGDGVSIVLDFTPAGKAKSKLLGVADDLQVSRATRNTDDILYRGVPGNATEKARLGQQGVAKPRGTATDPDSLRRHVLGEDVDSGVVSFSTDRNVARRFSGEGGTIIEVPRSSVQDRIVPRPDVGKYADESEVLIQGTVQGRATRP